MELISKLLMAITCVMPPTLGTPLEDMFDVQPQPVVQAEGLNAVFECFYSGAVAYSWLIGGKVLSLPAPSGIEIINPTILSPSRLIVLTTPHYNNSFVQCNALVEVEHNLFENVLSNSTTLQVQGPLHLQFQPWLSRVGSTSLTITWTPPFSLNLTTAEPDIQYCVDVYNVTGGGDNHLQSVCDITDTSYTFPAMASDPDQLFNFTVTPRSNVEGSLNGTTSQSVQGSLCLDRPRIQEISFFANVYLNPAVISYKFQETNMLCKVTRFYLEVVPVNEQDPSKHICWLSSTTRTNTSVHSWIVNSTSTVCNLERHKLYNGTIHEEYNGGNVTSDWMEISELEKLWGLSWLTYAP